MVDAIEINYEVKALLAEINKLIKKFNFDRVIWCCDPDKYTANVVSYLKKKKNSHYWYSARWRLSASKL